MGGKLTKPSCPSYYVAPIPRIIVIFLAISIKKGNNDGDKQ